MSPPTHNMKTHDLTDIVVHASLIKQPISLNWWRHQYVLHLAPADSHLTPADSHLAPADSHLASADSHLHLYTHLHTHMHQQTYACTDTRTWATERL